MGRGRKRLPQWVLPSGFFLIAILAARGGPGRGGGGGGGEEGDYVEANKRDKEKAKTQQAKRWLRDVARRCDNRAKGCV